MKTAIGKNFLFIDKSEATLKDIFKELKNKSKDAKIVDEKNLMVAVNGVDSSIIGGKEIVVKTGDIITIVPIIHGG
jgi:molybdopterin converting factor small subunit